ncbi:MAG: hypothetical protein ABIH34_04550 [Nanoarchaeota archaeon]
MDNKTSYSLEALEKRLYDADVVSVHVLTKALAELGLIHNESPEMNQLVMFSPSTEVYNQTFHEGQGMAIMQYSILGVGIVDPSAPKVTCDIRLFLFKVPDEIVKSLDQKCTPLTPREV